MTNYFKSTIKLQVLPTKKGQHTRIRRKTPNIFVLKVLVPIIVYISGE